MEVWRAAAPTVQAMIDERWDVISHCRKCGLTMHTDLRLIVKVSGPAATLWNRQGVCKKVGCLGVVEFQAKPPELHMHFRLFAEWPEGLKPR
jgi:hypothetical protein